MRNLPIIALIIATLTSCASIAEAFRNEKEKTIPIEDYCYPIPDWPYLFKRSDLKGDKIEEIMEDTKEKLKQNLAESKKTQIDEIMEDPRYIINALLIDIKSLKEYIEDRLYPALRYYQRKIPDCLE